MQTGDGELTGFSVATCATDGQTAGLDRHAYIDTRDVRGQLAAVADRRAEIAVGGISLTADRERTFDFSQPTLDAGLQIVVPVQHTRPSVPGLGGYLDLLLSRTMLIWLSAAVVVSAVPGARLLADRTSQREARGVALVPSRHLPVTPLGGSDRWSARTAPGDEDLHPGAGDPVGLRRRRLHLVLLGEPQCHPDRGQAGCEDQRTGRPVRQIRRHRRGHHRGGIPSGHGYPRHRDAHHRGLLPPATRRRLSTRWSSMPPSCATSSPTGAKAWP